MTLMTVLTALLMTVLTIQYRTALPINQTAYLLVIEFMNSNFMASYGKELPLAELLSY